MMTGVPPEMQAMMAQFPMGPEMMFGGMGMMPDPSAFGQQGFGGYGPPPTGPAAQQNFGGAYGGFPQQPQPQQGYGQQFGGQQMQQSQPQQSQIQAPKYPGQRVNSPTRKASPNLYELLEFA